MSGRYTKPKKARQTATRRHSGTHMLPTETSMVRELIDGQDCITVQFETVNVTFAMPLAISGWRQFIEDLETLIERGKPEERKTEQVTGTGLVLPGREEAEEFGGLPRLR